MNDKNDFPNVGKSMLFREFKRYVKQFKDKSKDEWQVVMSIEQVDERFFAWSMDAVGPNGEKTNLLNGFCGGPKRQ